jgi:hypothetical protein
LIASNPNVVVRKAVLAWRVNQTTDFLAAGAIGGQPVLGGSFREVISQKLVCGLHAMEGIEL